MIKEIKRTTGTVKWYDDRKGFGFVTSDKNGLEIFVHRTALPTHYGMDMDTGDRISFMIQEGRKGLVALDIKPLVEETQEIKETNGKNELNPVQYEKVNKDKKEIKIKTKSKVESKAKENLLSDSTGTDVDFTDLQLIPELLRAVKDEGYEEPTPIQAQAIPLVLNGRDVFGCAQTGTGKTAAFALPILQQLYKNSKPQNQSTGAKGIRKTFRKIKVLILAPTRELAIQIGDSFSDYGKYTGLRTTVVYGGVGQNPQVVKLKEGVDILAATPGRLLDLTNQGHIDLGHIEVLVFDEGDRMLDMGFIHDMRRILRLVPKKNRQTLLFSATIPREVIQLAKDMLHNPLHVNISPEQPTLEIIKQTVFIVSKKKKQKLLEHLLKDSTITRALVFMRTKHMANRVVRQLKTRGIRAEPIHGNKSQTARQAALENFRTGKTRVLVATDVASRGIDVEDISHVIQYDLPDVPETFLHRIGRTARAGAGGTAYAFCQPEQQKDLKKIEQFIRMKLKIRKKPPFNI